MTHHLKKSMSSCLLVSVLALLLVTTAAAKAAPLTCGTWSSVPSPNPGASHNHLSGVAAVSSTDVWAVGAYKNSGSGPSQTLVEHWNGTSWSVVTSPNVGLFGSTLSAVAAVSATDLWAVGVYFNSGDATSHALLEHWNGSSWSMVPSGLGGSLSGAVQVPNTNTLWAVGEASPEVGGTLAAFYC